MQKIMVGKIVKVIWELIKANFFPAAQLLFSSFWVNFQLSLNNWAASQHPKCIVKSYENNNKTLSLSLIVFFSARLMQIWLNWKANRRMGCKKCTTQPSYARSQSVDSMHFFINFKNCSKKLQNSFEKVFETILRNKLLDFL